MLIVFMSKGVYRGGGKEGSAPPRAVKGGGRIPPLELKLLKSQTEE